MYAAIQDVYDAWGQVNAEKWADLDNDVDANKIAARITRALELATEMVDTELAASRYDFPLHGNTTPPKTIVNAVAVIAGALLYEGRGVTDKNSTVRKRKLETMKYLARIKVGLATLPLTFASVAVPAVLKNAET